MELDLFLSFLAASILLTLMPGPDNIFVLTESITKGQRNGIAISTGLVSGVMVHTIAAATGLSIIIQQSETAFSLIKYLGAIYLFYLAFKSAKEEKPIIDIQNNGFANRESFGNLLKKGFLMNVLNPKVSLFFIAFLPQFLSKNGFHFTYQMIILGFVFMIQALVIFSSIAVLSGRLSRYLNKPGFWNINKWLKVIVLFSLAILLLLSEK